MKELIKKIIPKIFLEQIRLSKKKSNFKDKAIKETFTIIKDSDYWSSSESVSGYGSEIEVTREVSKGLEQLLQQLNIKSILDVPCGDFNWMQHVNLNDTQYIGADIVTSIIENNKTLYSSDTISFTELDLTKDSLPKTDLIFCRDCLVHLSYKELYKTLVNFKKSRSTYLLTTSFINTKTNKNIITGEWRKLNFEKKPFSFKKPLLIIDEKYTKKGEKDIDKSMCLWEIEDIKIPFLLKLYYWFT
jgi:2-polyprenyl-3-methyl-5-hydroxy-6-metoxy-1,4-benzoquinol methylase